MLDDGVGHLLADFAQLLVGEVHGRFHELAPRDAVAFGEDGRSDTRPNCCSQTIARLLV
jgi:hypothetical protein